MTTEPVRAGAHWLALREPADAEARSLGLVEQLRSWLLGRGAEVHDLGCGTGSMARWLAPRLDGPQHWVLHDRDADLLVLAGRHPPGTALDGARTSVESRCSDITRLAPDELAGAELVTASALLDMLTEDELLRLATSCARPGCPVLITLSVVGRVVLSPADPLDGSVMRAFNEHQRRNTTGGRLLGPDAVHAAVDAFHRLGRDVVVRSSPWRLAAGTELAAAWLAGWLAAACEQRPDLGGRVAAYAQRRGVELEERSLSVTVHHLDLLVAPAR